MRRTKTGAIHKHSLSIQQQGFTPLDPHEALRTATVQYLGQLNRFAPRWEHGGGMPVAMARAAMELLLEILEREK